MCLGDMDLIFIFIQFSTPYTANVTVFGYVVSIIDVKQFLIFAVCEKCFVG